MTGKEFMCIRRPLLFSLFHSILCSKWIRVVEHSKIKTWATDQKLYYSVNNDIFSNFCCQMSSVCIKKKKSMEQYTLFILQIAYNNQHIIMCMCQWIFAVQLYLRNSLPWFCQTRQYCQCIKCKERRKTGLYGQKSCTLIFMLINLFCYWLLK